MMRHCAFVALCSIARHSVRFLNHATSWDQTNESVIFQEWKCSHARGRALGAHARLWVPRGIVWNAVDIISLTFEAY